MRKKAILLISATLTASAAFVSFAAGSNFTDLPSSNWAYPAVSDMASKNIISGFPDGSFRPEEKVTYGEFIKMAVVTASGEDPGTAAETSSVKKHWAQNYYDLAVEKGYLKPGKIPKSALDQSIPRRDMALIISSILPEGSVNDYTQLEKQLSDVNSHTQNEYEIIRAYASGVLSGYPDGTFQPGETLNRAESASVIQRLAQPEKRILPLANEPKATTQTAITSGSAVTTESAVAIKGKYDGFKGEYGLALDGKTYIPALDNELILPVVESGPIEDIISNPERLNSHCGDEPKTKYVLTSTSEPFDFQIKKMVMGKGYYPIGRGLSQVVFIKDGKIIRYGGGQPYPDDFKYTTFDFNDVEEEPNNYEMVTDPKKLPDFDYIGAFDVTSIGGEYLLVIPNPWK